MHFTEVLDEREAKPGQTILVSNDQGADLSSNDAIDQCKQPLALQVETAANFFDPLIDDEPTSRTKLLKVLPLLDQVALLCRTGNPTIDNTPLLVCGGWKAQHQREIFIGIVALIRDRAMRLEAAFSVPPLQGLGDNPYQFGKLTNRVHVWSITHFCVQYQLSSTISFLDMNEGKHK